MSFTRKVFAEFFEAPGIFEIHIAYTYIYIYMYIYDLHIVKINEVQTTSRNMCLNKKMRC